MLHIDNLSKTYANGTRALDGISLNIDRGMFGLLGPNGAGKSTLMRILATLLDADEGRVTFDDINVLDSPQPLRQRLGYLPQEFGVYPRISAQHLLDHLAVLKGITDKKARREQVNHLLERTNLLDVRKKSVHTFSGGMKQRFGIAQALLGNPGLIIVDEPTAGLDPEERNRFHNLLSEIGENVVVILSTHIVDDVRDLCPRMAILARGKLVLTGEPKALIRQLAGRIWTRTIERDQLPDYMDSFRVLSTRLFAGKTQLRVYAADNPGETFLPATPDLEDVYFNCLADGKSA
ncbi:MAG TPA: ABC transporter ATP-binding protein [Calditrichia bacterium]|nr:ABC transporter ATP-binding protein [Calditrichia bacterium]